MSDILEAMPPKRGAITALAGAYRCKK